MRQTECTCHLCGKSISFSNNTTANNILKLHYKEAHPDEYQQVKDAWNAYLELSMKYKFTF